MTNDLDARILEAQRAADELARLERLRAELPELQAERIRLTREDKARQQLEAVEARSGQVLADFRPAVASWRQRFAVLVQEAEGMARELGEIERPLPQLARDLVGAVQGANAAGVPTSHAARLWLDLGWGADDLEALPDRNDGRASRVPDFDERVAALLAERAGVNVLRPSAGVRQYVRGV